MARRRRRGVGRTLALALIISPSAAAPVRGASASAPLHGLQSEGLFESQRLDDEAGASGSTKGSNNKGVLYFTHIPKTGGESLAELVAAFTAENGSSITLQHFERSPTAAERQRAFVATMLRSPRAHVLSMFMHCKYFRPNAEHAADGLYYKYTDTRSFPTWGEEGTESDVRGLGAWLDRALTDARTTVNNFESPTPLAAHGGVFAQAELDEGRMIHAEDQLHFDDEMFGCYSPWNLQSRTIAFDRLTKRQLRPEWEAVEASLEQYDAVGINELFEATACLLDAGLGGKQLSGSEGSARRGEGPCSVKGAEAGAALGFSIPNNTHDVPHLALEDVPEALLAKVDALTEVDARAYDWAKERLVPLLCAAGVRRDLLKESFGTCEAAGAAAGAAARTAWPNLPWPTRQIDVAAQAKPMSMPAGLPTRSVISDHAAEHSEAQRSLVAARQKMSPSEMQPLYPPSDLSSDLPLDLVGDPAPARLDERLSFAFDEPSSSEGGAVASPAIPLHLLLISDQGKDEALVAAWKAANPGLRVTFMSPCDGVRFLNNSSLWDHSMLAAYRSIRTIAFKSDFLRLCFLAEHGGFYVDMDEYPGERSLTELIAMGKPLILANNTASKRDLRVYNAFIGAVPHHPALVSLAEQALVHVQNRFGDAMATISSPLEEVVVARAAAVGIAGPALFGELINPASNQSVLGDVYMLKKIDQVDPDIRDVGADGALDARSAPKVTSHVFEDFTSGWVESWRCSNLHWDIAIMLRSIYWSPSTDGHPTTAECAPEADFLAASHVSTPPFVAITHHKSGTVAAFNLFMATCCTEAAGVANALDFWDYWYGRVPGQVGRCDTRCAAQGLFFTPGGLGRVVEDSRLLPQTSPPIDLQSNLCFALPRPSLRQIHFVRDPATMVVSGYLYTLGCPEQWMRQPFQAVNADEHRFGNRASFEAVLVALGITPNRWNHDNMTWCEAVAAATPEQGIHAEALRTTSADDGVRAMLEDRLRLQGRTAEVGADAIELCCDALSSADGAAEWARLSEFVNATVAPSEALIESHAVSNYSAIDGSFPGVTDPALMHEDLIGLADTHLRSLLTEELQAAFPCQTPAEAAVANGTADGSKTIEVNGETCSSACDDDGCVPLRYYIGGQMGSSRSVFEMLKQQAGACAAQPGKLAMPRPSREGDENHFFDGMAYILNGVGDVASGEAASGDATSGEVSWSSWHQQWQQRWEPSLVTYQSMYRPDTCPSRCFFDYTPGYLHHAEVSDRMLAVLPPVIVERSRFLVVLREPVARDLAFFNMHYEAAVNHGNCTTWYMLDHELWFGGCKVLVDGARQSIEVVKHPAWFDPKEYSAHPTGMAVQQHNYNHTLTKDIYDLRTVALVSEWNKCAADEWPSAELYERCLPKNRELGLGMYYALLSRWYRRFDRSSFSVWRMESIDEDVAGFQAEVFKFLGMPASAKVDGHMPDEPARSRDFSKRVDRMNCGVRDLLQKVYAPWNEALFDFDPRLGKKWTSEPVACYPGMPSRECLPKRECVYPN